MVEPLRARRVRQLREELSSIATRMFLAEGFNAVRVSDVARAAGVTEKTVFNHFPTKEALLTDRWEPLMAALRAELARPDISALDAFRTVLEQELVHLLTPSEARSGAQQLADVHRYIDLVQTTPALMADERQARAEIADAVAEELALREDVALRGPAITIVASSVAALELVFYRALHRCLGDAVTNGVFTDLDLPEIQAAVLHDLDVAVNQLKRGL